MNYNNPLSPILTLVALVITICMFSPTDGAAEAVKAQQWEITADKLTRYEDPPSIIAEGNVVLEKSEQVTRQDQVKEQADWSGLLGESPEQAIEDEQPDPEKSETVTTTKVITTIKADWMVYDMDLGTVKSRGNVLIDIGPDQLAADEGVINLNRETGTFTNATIIRQYKEMHFEGRVIEKTGDLSYHIEDGWVITCKLQEGETPPWSFGASEADITDGGYMFLKHAVFRIKNVPILYSPIMILPAKRTRQTGFLFPSISGSDRDGFGMEFPLFINLSPNSDITLYPQYMTKRGFMGGLELRYVLDQESKGGFMANFLNDNLSDINDPDNADYYRDGDYTHTNQDRYWIRGKADQDIGEWTTRLDVDIVSDRDYLTEFNTGLTGFNMSNSRFSDVFGRGFQNRTADERKNTLRALRSWDNGMSLQANLLGINDLRFAKNSPTPLWKLPEVNYKGLMSVYDTGVDFSWNTDYVYYWRKDGVGAHRVDLFPRVTMAVPLSDYLETVVAGGVRNTSYFIKTHGNSDWPDSVTDDETDDESLLQNIVTEYKPDWQDGDTENRFLGDFRAEIATTMIRDFNINAGSATGLSHTFRPYVRYKYISDVNQDDLPQFDSVDDVGDQNLVTYGLDNFFSLSGQSGDRKYDRDYGFIKIKQGYDIRSEESDTPFTPVNVRLQYNPLKDLRFIYRTDVDVYGEGFLKHLVENDYRNSRGDIFSLDYRYDKGTILDDLNDLNELDDLQGKTSSIKARARVGLFYNWIVGYSIESSLEDDKTVEQTFNLIYAPACWSVEFAANQTPGDEKYTIMFRLANIGSPLGLDLPGL